ncbi:hypothetical protein FB567DRAFT_31840 [Paraphoma chrysanthemicola]|uniref:NAD-dependent epimerase/dehydratase domain-containing protein n=1 Tax=Paraphoma chrysanthemicola TaxID=798071 RepID=A0A8K0RI95_9PLEO|nr:hypothetical protein FB567DRAFT_31840 [Paraphoma chrysanthemicola]
MSHSILLTGASGYLGGSLLTHLHIHRNDLPAHKAIYALVRTHEQAEAVQKFGVKPLFLNLKDEAAVTESIVDTKITIVYFLIDAIQSDAQLILLKALGKVKQETGQEVHFLHTSGAKIFSQHAGFPTDRTISDADPELYDISKTVTPPHEIMKVAVKTNQDIIDTAEKYGVRSYIFAPCIVYGESDGFGNKISIQTTAIVKAAKGAGAVYDVNPEDYTWPVCHISDNTSLYLRLLKEILSGGELGYGKSGYYLASSGSVAWRDIYAAMAKALQKRGVVRSSEVRKADDSALKKLSETLGCPKELVAVQIGGKCTFKTDRANMLGWKAEHTADHILDAVDAEVELILSQI